jgi:hypothetical protein
MTTHKEKAFKDNFGGSASVTREAEKSERAFKENGKLKDIGRRLKPEEDCDYIGSAAVHLYIQKGSEIIIQDDVALFKCQTTSMQNATSQMANASAIQLNQQLQEMYTGRMQTRKSGF